MHGNPAVAAPVDTGIDRHRCDRGAENAGRLQRNPCGLACAIVDLEHSAASLLSAPAPQVIPA